MPSMVDLGWEVRFGQNGVRELACILDGGCNHSHFSSQQNSSDDVQFLVLRSGATNRVHLVKWEDLAKPKSYGGWGVKNQMVFSRALATNNLWHCLMKEGLWHRVLKDKYLTSFTVVA
jgi:hypothetical protein